MNKNFLKVVCSELLKVVTAPMRLLPIKKNRILFTGLTGGKNYDYSCNPRYIYEYLRDTYPGRYEYVWAVSDKEKYSFLEEEGVKLIRHFTVSSFPMLLTSKVIVTNGSYVPWFPFRKKQYVINTWHGGGAYKKVENETPSADWATKKRAEFCANNINLFLASCKVQEEQMIQTTYQYTGEVLRMGTPRNDKLVSGDTEDMIKKVKEYYTLDQETHILMYAPTYRNANPSVIFDADAVWKLLNSGNEKWVIFSRFHRYQEADMHVEIAGSHIIDVADYPDMQELLAITDILITDYSSVIWDYMLLNKPCFLYVPDKEEYTKNTGFYVELNEWPYEQVCDMNQLMDKLLDYDKEAMQNRIKQHLEQLGSYESGACCEAIAQKIAREIMPEITVESEK